MVNALRIHPEDNVAVALQDLPAGTTLQFSAEDLDGHIVAQEAIPFGHKIALRPIQAGETVVKYGASIGLATQAIACGQHVHVHNLASVRGAATR